MRAIMTTYFEDIEEFCENIVEVYEDTKAETDRYEDVSIIALYEDACRITSELIRCGFEIKEININDSDWDGYDDEYIISVYNDGIWVEPFKRKDEYLNEESGCTYVLQNCNSKCLDKITSKKLYEVVFLDDEDDDYEDENPQKISNCNTSCDCCKDKVSTTTTSIYEVNGKKVSKEEYDKALSKYDKMYSNMLHRYEEISSKLDSLIMRYF